MDERESLGRASTPQGGRVELVRERSRIAIYIDGLLLMTSSAHGSEVAMADLGCQALGPGARVLVGGLGLGYTLRAVLDAVPQDAEVVCVELLEALGRWHRQEPLASLSGNAVGDPRVKLRISDIVTFLDDSAEASFDAILLDVDNGPIAMTLNSNAWLYGAEGLAVLRRLLRSNGTLVVWSADDNPRFTARLREAGFQAETHHVAAGDGPESAGVEHVLFVGRA